MSRTTALARAILERLQAAKPYALPEAQLLTEVNGTVRPPATLEEFAVLVQILSAAPSRIAVLRDEFDPEAKKWVITESGEAALLR